MEGKIASLLTDATVLGHLKDARVPFNFGKGHSNGGLSSQCCVLRRVVVGFNEAKAEGGSRRHERMEGSGERRCLDRLRRTQKF